MGTYILGLQIGHDSSAAVIHDGEVIAAASEERFLRVKHYGELPWRSSRFCLKQAGISMEDIDILAIPTVSSITDLAFMFPALQHHPVTQRRGRQLLSFFGSVAGRSQKVLPLHKEPFKTKPGLTVIQVEHHLAHAASAYRTSGFEQLTLIITADGIGNNISLAVWRGADGEITPLMKVGPEGSLGWFYGAVTEGLGWWVGDGEGKTMGLAPYGDARRARGCLDALVPCYQGGKLVEPHDFGAPGYWIERGSYQWHLRDAELVREAIARHGRENVAAEAQRLLEEQMLDVIINWLDREGTTYLASAGGVFLNVKLNQRIWESGKVTHQFTYPNAGDGGLAVGAALEAYHKVTGDQTVRAQDTVYMGPAYLDKEIQDVLEVRRIPYERIDDVAGTTAELLARGAIVGWMQGRMEFGPRALGSRSILMDPSKAEHKDIINNSVKYREPFRPFCPSMVVEAVKDYLVNGRIEPHMITSFCVKPDMVDRIPAVVHVDGTARPQTVTRHSNPLYWDLIRQFGQKTGVPVLLNTSFNIKGDPIICSPADAVQSFFNTGMDYLVMGSFLVSKNGK